MMNKKILVILVPIAVIILGTIGFLQQGLSGYDAFLSSLDLLKVKFDPYPFNPFIEAGRWLGVIFFFGVIYAALTTIVESGAVFVKTLSKDAVAVHGDSVYAEMLVKALGKKCIRSSKKVAFRAPRQVILFEKDSQAVEFYQKHAAELSKAAEVHLCLELGNRVSIDSENLFITNMSEVRAIDYWTRHYSKKSENITIVGSGQLAEAVLYWGLLTNIFDIDCKNEYRLFGNFDRFIAIHEGLAAAIHDYGNDDIFFSEDEWYQDIDTLAASDRIILCGDTLNNVENALDMRFAGMDCPIHLFAENNNIRTFSDDSVEIVGTLSTGNIKDVLLMDSIHTAGKLCHATYMAKETRSPEEIDADTLRTFIGSPEFAESWKKLDSFTRGSNYAAAIHDPQKKDLLAALGIDVTGMTAAENSRRYNALNDHDKNRLQEIEHIRWCRYHLLNNWKRSDSEIRIGGEVKRKDSKNRLHTDLVPYAELPDKEKTKDSSSYETLSLRI